MCQQDILIAVAGRLLAVRRHDLLHPVAQPLPQRQAHRRVRSTRELRAAVVRDRLLSLLHGGIGPCAPHAAARPVIIVERDIEQVVAVIVGQVSFQCFSHVISLFPL